MGELSPVNSVKETGKSSASYVVLIRLQPDAARKLAVTLTELADQTGEAGRVGLAPGYSQAWSGIAEALTWLAIIGFERGSEVEPQAVAAATRSIERDPGSAAAHTTLACATLVYENNRSRAAQEFESARPVC